MNENDGQYFEYLTGRSKLGYFYRRYIFHPRIVARVEGRCLDVGCGIGDFVKHCPNCIGVDINSRSVEYCLSRGLDVRVSKENEIPFENDSFDTVLLDNVLEHLASPENLVNEINRVLRPGGIFIVGVPGEKGYSKDPDHKIYYDKALLTSTVEGLGFTLDHVVDIPVPGLSKYLSSFCHFGVFKSPNAK